MSDYAHRPGGSLKFKGESKKKKKKKSHSSAEHAKLADRDASIDKDEGMENAKVREGGVEGGGARKLTEAERRFEETQRQRRSERAVKLAKMTHKDRVSELNSKLDRLSEHHDLPRIGPG